MLFDPGAQEWPVLFCSEVWAELAAPHRTWVSSHCPPSSSPAAGQDEGTSPHHLPPVCAGWHWLDHGQGRAPGWLADSVIQAPQGKAVPCCGLQVRREEAFLLEEKTSFKGRNE